MTTLLLVIRITIDSYYSLQVVKVVKVLVLVIAQIIITTISAMTNNRTHCITNSS